MRVILAISLMALFTGCSMVRSDVNRFDQLPQSTAGQTVYFLPLEEQEGSAAYRVYADRVAAELAKHGMRRADDIATADYAVIMAYGSGSGRQISGAIPLYGQTGGGTTHYSGSVSTFGSSGSSFGSYSGQSYSAPTYGMVGIVPYTRTEYDRFLTVRMIDLERSTEEDIVPVYEGNVLSTGKAASFDQVAGCMIQALFQNFRQSGSARVSMAPSACRQALELHAGSATTGVTAAIDSSPAPAAPSSSSSSAGHVRSTQTGRSSAPTAAHTTKEPAVASIECPIKGNVESDGRRLFYLPGHRWYDLTSVQEARGEEWFCSEEEANSAGWRRAPE